MPTKYPLRTPFYQHDRFIVQKNSNNHSTILFDEADLLFLITNLDRSDDSKLIAMKLINECFAAAAKELEKE